MGQIRIITDTASDITRQRAEELDVIVVPISIKFGETEMPMESEEDFHRFFRRLAEEKELPTTSQPSPERASWFHTQLAMVMIYTMPPMAEIPPPMTVARYL